MVADELGLGRRRCRWWTPACILTLALRAATHRLYSIAIVCERGHAHPPCTPQERVREGCVWRGEERMPRLRVRGWVGGGVGGGVGQARSTLRLQTRSTPLLRIRRRPTLLHIRTPQSPSRQQHARRGRRFHLTRREPPEPPRPYGTHLGVRQRPLHTHPSPVAPWTLQQLAWRLRSAQVPLGLARLW